jgi:hypothetical protein
VSSPIAQPPTRANGMSRAEHRLDIARGLLGLPPGADVMATIRRLPEARSQELQGLTDWVEAYDLGEPA